MYIYICIYEQFFHAQQVLCVSTISKYVYIYIYLQYIYIRIRTFSHTCICIYEVAVMSVAWMQRAYHEKHGQTHAWHTVNIQSKHIITVSNTHITRNEEARRVFKSISNQSSNSVKWHSTHDKSAWHAVHMHIAWDVACNEVRDQALMGRQHVLQRAKRYIQRHTLQGGEDS